MNSEPRKIKEIWIVYTKNNNFDSHVEVGRQLVEKGCTDFSFNKQWSSLNDCEVQQIVGYVLE